MEKIKYDSLYKFIVSIGIAIIILPFVLLNAILKNNEMITISANHINELTNTAQEVISLEQGYKHFLLKHIGAFSIITILFDIVGIFIVIYGVVQWRNKVQKYEDKSRELSNELLEKQIKNLTKEEKEEMLRKDIEMIKEENNPKNSNISTKVKENSKDISENKEKEYNSEELKQVENKPDNVESDSNINEYVNIQEKIYKSIKKIFKGFKIYDQVKIEDQKYSCIAVDKNDYISYDYIFEIKFFEDIKSIKRRIYDILEQLSEKDAIYCENNRRHSRLVLIIVIRKFSEKDQLENQKILNEIKGIRHRWTKIILTDDNVGIEKELEEIRKYYWL